LAIHVDSFAAVLSVAILWALAAISPGPNFLVIARLSIMRSRRDGMLAVAGIAIGTMIWGAAGCFGVQALFVAVPWMYLTLKLLGALYLILMGANLIWQSRQAVRNDRADVDQAGSKSSPFWLGLVTTVANPRSAVSVASIFATTMPNHPSLALSLVVIATMVAVSIGWYSIVTCLFTVRQLSAAYQRGRRWVDRFTGACFILFGAKLASEP
jgi:threonine/homoserine/homoserine lactone efflux protein